MSNKSKVFDKYSLLLSGHRGLLFLRILTDMPCFRYGFGGRKHFSYAAIPKK